MRGENEISFAVMAAGTINPRAIMANIIKSDGSQVFLSKHLMRNARAETKTSHSATPENKPRPVRFFISHP